MRIHSLIKQKLRKKYRLCGIVSMITGKAPLLHRYIEAYCTGNFPVILIEGNSSDPNIYYKIAYGEKDNCDMGFFALIYRSASCIYFAETCGLKPIVIWGEHVLYHEPSITETENVFEYYYLPIGNSRLKLENKKYRYVESKSVDFLFLDQNSTGYRFTEQGYRRFAEIYRKYFHLNEKTRKYLEDNIGILMGNRKHVLGVHLRGTDFKRQYNDHPSFVGFQHHVELTRKLMEKYRFDSIFVATDDGEALELMQREFGERVLYYKDCSRGRGDVSVMSAPVKNRYTMGLEVVRDAYTLSCCEALVCGLSQFSSAARYIKMARGEDFVEIAKIPQILNHNTNYCHLDKANIGI